MTETQIVTETETWEIEGGLKGPKDEHTHMELARLNGGELADCVVTQCGQLDSLLQERGEGICPLEADHDQVGPVMPSEVGGASAVDRCTPSLGGIETPEPLVVMRIPSVVMSVVPVCVFTSVAKCVLQRAHSVGARACVRATACVTETPCVSGTTCAGEMARVSERLCVSGTTCAKEMVHVSEARCVRGTACVRSLCVREMMVGMRENAAASPSGSVMMGVCERCGTWELERESATETATD